MIWKQNTELSQYNLFRENGYSAFSAVALCKAGIKTLDEADEFLNDDELCDFRLIRNIDKATDIIWKHIFAHNRICIFGDYDADGISASAVMFLALKKMGAEVCVRLPDRIEEGYGISKKAIKEQAECGARLFVTVDNGVRAVEETEYVKELGLDIVILDHHEPGEVMPQADALIDLHIEGETYPYKELTGSDNVSGAALLEKATAEYDEAKSQREIYSNIKILNYDRYVNPENEEERTITMLKVTYNPQRNYPYVLTVANGWAVPLITKLKGVIIKEGSTRLTDKVVISLEERKMLSMLGTVDSFLKAMMAYALAPYFETVTNPILYSGAYED